jgi:FemAB-related protein (PEP-CTERM system-associated)
MTAANVLAISAEASRSPVKVRDFHHADGPAWDAFVQSQPQASPFHLTSWMRSIEKTFGYEPRYLCAERKARITGVLPLFCISNAVMGRCLISIPFADYGGVCAAEKESRDALIAAASEVAFAEGVDFLELRDRASEPYAQFHPKSLYVGFSTNLPVDPGTMLKSLPRDTRYMIRKGQKAGLELRSGVEQMPVFYELVVANWRRLGTPVFSPHWLDTMVTEFGNTLDLKVVYRNQKAVAGVLSILFQDAIFPHYAGANAAANDCSANNFMYWELMKFAIEIGLRRFDFGRSKRGTGAYQFKSSWNMDVEPLAYQVLLVKRKDLPNISPLNLKFRLATRAWSRLPLRTTTWLGPKLVRWFP